MSTALEISLGIKRWGRNPCMKRRIGRASWIIFSPWQAKEWMLLLSRLDAMSISHEGESERLELFFSHHHVIMIGENLRQTMTEILNTEVESVRDMPVSYRAGLEPTDPFVSRLEVHVPAEPKGRQTQGALF